MKLDVPDDFTLSLWLILDLAHSELAGLMMDQSTDPDLPQWKEDLEIIDGLKGQLNVSQ